MSKVLIFGATGMLGSSLRPYLDDMGYEVFTAGRSEESDIFFSAPDAPQVFFDDVRSLSPEVIINLIAATNVDQCEQYSELAWELNSEIVKTISSLSSHSFHPHFIHISSDQVYSGPGRHIEINPMPCNVYGSSKLAGEKWILDVGGTILRTNFVGASRKFGRDGFTDWLFKGAQSLTSIKVISDVIFSPGHISDVCQAIEIIIRHRHKGVFNFGSKTPISKAAFSFAFLSSLGAHLEMVEEVNLKDLNFLAKRPNDMSLDISLYEKVFDQECPEIIEVIKKCVQDYINE